MYSVKINNKISRELLLSNGHAILDGINVPLDILKIREGMYHLVAGDKCYTAEVLSADFATKTFTLRINGEVQHVQVQDDYDRLLHQLGMDVKAAGVVNEIKAPMPGMVLSVLVKENDEIKKGDPLLVLEAMKMENVLKSPGNGVIRKINVKEKQAVEKNQVLINLV
jgi:biotin carboxyl carrier protein